MPTKKGPTRSPLHSSALRIGDLNPGMQIVRFNRAFGAEYCRVVSKPYVLVRPENMSAFRYSDEGHIVIDLQSVRFGSVNMNYLSDMGVIPYKYGNWNQSNFTIEARKSELLPPVDDFLREQILRRMREDIW